MTTPTRDRAGASLTDAFEQDTGAPGGTPDGHALDAYEVDPVYDITSDELQSDRFLDRELSWLRFNQRVLELAEDEGVPLLERARFCAIFASNLDEFFMVRVAGLKRRIVAGVAVPSASGLQPREVLETIWAATTDLMQRHASVFRDKIIPA